MDTISISQFKATCLGALERVRKTGRPLLVTKRGTPVAQVIPPPKPTPTKSAYGCMAEGVRELGDIVEPLPAEDWEISDWDDL
jgi:prevent-host-death family protein